MTALRVLTSLVLAVYAVAVVCYALGQFTILLLEGM
jgi:hypothetical protein